MKAKLLRATLWVTGGLFCLAAPFLFVPETWLRAMAGWFFGASAVDALWPTGAATDYILRTSMVAYLWIGIVLLVAATNPERHRTQVLIAIGGLFLLAIVTLVTGLANSLPLGWFLGDAVTSLLGAVLLFAFRPAKA